MKRKLEFKTAYKCLRTGEIRWNYWRQDDYDRLADFLERLWKENKRLRRALRVLKKEDIKSMEPKLRRIK